jgi:hypothetical protein
MVSMTEARPHWEPGKHSTMNIQLPTPNEVDSAGGLRAFQLERRSVTDLGLSESNSHELFY